jgi:hypothetical protein
MKQRAALRMGRMSRWVRGWWPDRNPLRRRCDRVEAGAAAGLIAALFVVGPVVGVIGAQAAYDASLRLQQLERASSHRVAAVLLARAPAPPGTTAGAPPRGAGPACADVCLPRWGCLTIPVAPGKHGVRRWPTWTKTDEPSLR